MAEQLTPIDATKALVTGCVVRVHFDAQVTHDDGSGDVVVVAQWNWPNPERFPRLIPREWIGRCKAVTNG